MPTKNTSRTLWVLVAAIVAAFLLYFAFAGPNPRPKPQNEFPSEPAPPTT